MKPIKLVHRTNESEVHDEIFKLLSHLHAQTMLISGEGMENFMNHNDEIKGNYLWAICDLAERSLQLLSKVSRPVEILKAEWQTPPK